MKREPKDILSLFDGCSCGQIALNNSGIKYDKYYASEIDKFAIKVTQINYPDTIQLGDVTKWQEWDINYKNIKLILAGFPCQDFSFAGKQLSFKGDKGKLFFTLIKILNYCRKFNPDVKFLFENVQMTKKNQKVINDLVGLFPVLINSALVSAQNRNRNYWTNFRTKKVGLFSDIYSDIPQPADRGILLKDILQPESEIGQIYDNNAQGGRIYSSGGGVGAKTGLYQVKQLNDSKESGGKQPYQQNRIYDENGLSPALNSQLSTGSNAIFNNSKIRRLTPLECSRLQTMPDDYFFKDGKQIVSDSQIYKMLGNGWTVAVIEHIFKFML